MTTIGVPAVVTATAPGTTISRSLYIAGFPLGRAVIDSPPLFVYDAAMRSELNQLIQRFLATVQGRGIALDVGAGEGYYALKLARAGLRVTAIDVDQKRLAVLEHRAQRFKLPITTLVRDVARWSIPHGQFDFIAAVNALHFLSHTVALGVIHRLIRALKPGGVLLLAIHHRSGGLYRSYRNSGRRGISFFTQKEILHAVEGLKVMYVHIERFSDKRPAQHIVYLLAEAPS